jgi:peptidoglycan/LPS O-acetylase OafA/YrhL
MHWSIAISLALIWICTKNTVTSATTFAIAAGYITLYLAYTKTLKLPAFVGDYSYGIYLYAFPIQQIVSYLLPWTTPYQLMAISLPASWLAGAISWSIIEKPALNLKNKVQLRAEQAKMKAYALNRSD